MAESDNPSTEFEQQAASIKAEVGRATDDIFELTDAVMMMHLYHLCTLWADLQIYVIDPLLPTIYPPKRVMPQPIDEQGHLENVFPIIDEGFRMSTSRGEQGLALGMSQLKYYNTIEKMVHMMILRLREAWGRQEGDGDGSAEPEAQIAFYGHELGQRKAFESVMNLPEKVIVSNFNGGSWADSFMQMVLAMVERGYGAPHESPRKTYRGPETPYPSNG